MEEAKKYIRYLDLSCKSRTESYKLGFITAYKINSDNVYEEVIKITNDKIVLQKNVKNFLKLRSVTIDTVDPDKLIVRAPQIRLMTAYELIKFNRTNDKNLVMLEDGKISNRFSTVSSYKDSQVICNFWGLKQNIIFHNDDKLYDIYIEDGQNKLSILPLVYEVEQFRYSDIIQASAIKSDYLMEKYSQKNIKLLNENDRNSVKSMGLTTEIIIKDAYPISDIVELIKFGDSYITYASTHEFLNGTNFKVYSESSLKHSMKKVQKCDLKLIESLATSNETKTLDKNSTSLSNQIAVLTVAQTIIPEEKNHNCIMSNYEKMKYAEKNNLIIVLDVEDDIIVNPAFSLEEDPAITKLKYITLKDKTPKNF